MEHLAAALEAAQKANKTLEANAQRIHERLHDLVARMRAERTGSSASAGRPDRTITELRTFDGRVTAKAALDENGWMRRLYISDAELLQPPESR